MSTFDVSALEPQWQAMVSWVESTVGGRVTRAERQARWRPAWYLDVTTDTGTVPVYFRGGRGGPASMQLLRHEGSVLQVLERHDVPVPHVYGVCEEPEGLLLAGVPGVDAFHRAPADVQDAVAEEFLQALARWHAIPAEEFEAVGLPRPASATEQALMDLDHLEAAYRAARSAPAPLLEFALAWLRRNVPAEPGRTVLVQGDTGPGQFLFDDGRLTAVIDWELSKLGDPMYDLACVRGRDLSYPFGDLPARLARYAEISGTPVDLPKLRYYSVRSLIITPLSLSPLLASRSPMHDYSMYLAWDAVYGRAMVECLAEAAGVDLDPVPELPEVTTSRSHLHDVVVGALQGEIAELAGDAFAGYRVRSIAMLADHLRLAERIGPAVDAARLSEAAALTGASPTTVAEADAAVEQLVARSGPERDADLIRYFYRQAVRNEQLVGPLLGELAETATLSPVA